MNLQFASVVKRSNLRMCQDYGLRYWECQALKSFHISKILLVTQRQKLVALNTWALYCSTLFSTEKSLLKMFKQKQEGPCTCWRAEAIALNDSYVTIQSFFLCLDFFLNQFDITYLFSCVQNHNLNQEKNCKSNHRIVKSLLRYLSPDPGRFS